MDTKNNLAVVQIRRNQSAHLLALPLIYIQKHWPQCINDATVPPIHHQGNELENFGSHPRNKRSSRAICISNWKLLRSDCNRAGPNGGIARRQSPRAEVASNRSPTNMKTACGRRLRCNHFYPPIPRNAQDKH